VIFEGSEKKVEIVVSLRDSEPSLRQLGEAFWERVVREARAQILSRISSDFADAYLLSESSLFVSDSRVTLITCGQTTLVRAVESIIEGIGLDRVEVLFYERKNEYFPDKQFTSFDEDSDRLAKLLPGKAEFFGNENGHFVSMFHYENKYVPSESDTTLEILMHGLGKTALNLFCTPGQCSVNRVRSEFAIEKVIPGYQVDDFCFDPIGYSLNALNKNRYYTIHVTPEKEGSYASFETNHYIDNGLGRDLTLNLISFFKPRSFLTVQFKKSGCLIANAGEIDFYRIVQSETRTLSSGYDVQFCQYLLKD